MSAFSHVGNSILNVGRKILSTQKFICFWEGEKVFKGFEGLREEEFGQSKPEVVEVLVENVEVYEGFVVVEAFEVAEAENGVEDGSEHGVTGKYP